MASGSKALVFPTLDCSTPFSSCRSLTFLTNFCSSASSSSSSSSSPSPSIRRSPTLYCTGRVFVGISPSRKRQRRHTCRAAEYKFPDPIPEFADAETEKFRSHLLNKLSKKDLFGDSVEEVVGVCTEIFSTFLHTEYGGPGTLLVIPFIDMADTLNERGLPGGPKAARAAVKWAQKHIDKDWKEWTGGSN